MGTEGRRELVYPTESYAIVGALFEVYRERGSGFLEAVYQECVGLEFEARGIPFVAQPALELAYKGTRLEQTYRPDFVCYATILLELKAVQALLDEHRAQLFNYLRASGMRLGILANFGTPRSLQYERIVI